jgi:hypothetical protein
MVRVARKVNRWLLIVSGRKAAKSVVAYYECHDIHECFAAFAQAIRHGKVDWRQDKYAKNNQ